MTPEEGLYSYLTADANLTTLIGSRIYPNIIPEGSASPAVAYQRISSRRWHPHDGRGGLAQVRVQLTITGDSYQSVKGVAEAIREALDGYEGPMGPGGGLEIEGCLIDNEIDGFDLDTAHQTVRQDYLIMYKE